MVGCGWAAVHQTSYECLRMLRCRPCRHTICCCSPCRRVAVCPGADRVTLAQFLCDHDKHLAAVRRKVLDGRYTFAALLECEIPKPDSKTEQRTIGIPTIRDIIAQPALYECLHDIVVSIHHNQTAVRRRICPAVQAPIGLAAYGRTDMPAPDGQDASPQQCSPRQPAPCEVARPYQPLGASRG